jgi:hypothetical protein
MIVRSKRDCTTYLELAEGSTESSEEENDAPLVANHL